MSVILGSFLINSTCMVLFQEKNLLFSFVSLLCVMKLCMHLSLKGMSVQAPLGISMHAPLGISMHAGPWSIRKVMTYMYMYLEPVWWDHAMQWVYCRKLWFWLASIPLLVGRLMSDVLVPRYMHAACMVSVQQSHSLLTREISDSSFLFSSITLLLL